MMTTPSATSRERELIESSPLPAVPLRYLLSGESLVVPDAMVLTCCGVQRTVYRGDGESGTYFWHRVQWLAVVLSLGQGENRYVYMRCVYGVKPPTDAAIKRIDAEASMRNELRHEVNRVGATEAHRLEATLKLADLLWPDPATPAAPAPKARRK